MDQMCSHFESLDVFFFTPHLQSLLTKSTLLVLCAWQFPSLTMAATLFDAAALTLFFKDAKNMGLTNCTCLQLAVEGITKPDDFKEFKDNGMTASS